LVRGVEREGRAGRRRETDEILTAGGRDIRGEGWGSGGEGKRGQDSSSELRASSRVVLGGGGGGGGGEGLLRDRAAVTTRETKRLVLVPALLFFDPTLLDK
jgi:hypothetical protein